MPISVNGRRILLLTATATAGAGGSPACLTCGKFLVTEVAERQQQVAASSRCRTARRCTGRRCHLPGYMASLSEAMELIFLAIVGVHGRAGGSGSRRIPARSRRNLFGTGGICGSADGHLPGRTVEAAHVRVHERDPQASAGNTDGHGPVRIEAQLFGDNGRVQFV